MIKCKGKFKSLSGNLFGDDPVKSIWSLPDGEYSYLVVDKTVNKNLPFLTYLFSVVLKSIQDELPDHPSPTCLYKYFEELFAPVHTCTINGSTYQYKELKGEKQRDVNDVIEKIIEYALDYWGIEIPKNDELRDPEARELYSQAYLNQEVNWSSFISRRKQHLSKDERRNEQKDKA